MNAKRLTHICATNEPMAQKEETTSSLQERSDLRSDQASSKPSDARAMEALTPYQFPVVGREKVWFAPKARDSEWRSVFTGIDVTAEYRKAYAWLQANPTKKKTARGMAHFLYGWLERAQNNQKSAPQDARCHFHRAPGTLRKRPPMGFVDTCPECKHARAGTVRREGDPSSIADLAAATEAKLARDRKLTPATPEQIAELKAARGAQ